MFDHVSLLSANQSTRYWADGDDWRKAGENAKAEKARKRKFLKRKFLFQDIPADVMRK